MPATFPAHAAAVLPLGTLARGRLPLVALIVGSCAPDLAYVLGEFGELAHSPVGLLAFCLPAGLVALVWTEALLLPALRACLPRALGVDWARLAASPGLPRGWGGWAAAAGAVVLGAATHLLWDGLTHANQWPGTRLYPQGAALGPLPADELAQLGSTVLGTLAVAAYARRRYPHLPGRQAPPVRGARWLLVAGAAGAAFGIVWRLHSPITTGASELWFLFWSAVRYALPPFTLACAAVLWAPRR